MPDWFTYADSPFVFIFLVISLCSINLKNLELISMCDNASKFENEFLDWITWHQSKNCLIFALLVCFAIPKFLGTGFVIKGPKYLNYLLKKSHMCNLYHFCLTCSGYIETSFNTIKHIILHYTVLTLIVSNIFCRFLTLKILVYNSFPWNYESVCCVIYEIDSIIHMHLKHKK